MKISIVTLKKMIHEVLKEQALTRSGASYTGPSAGVRDRYVGGGAAPSEATERAELIRLGYMTPEGALTPSGRTYVSNLIDSHARSMYDAYRRTGRMPSEGDASLGRLGLGGMEASARNQAVRRAHAMIRGTGLERGSERMGRRSGAPPAPAGASLADLMSRATGGGREPDFASMASGAPVVGSALPTRTASTVVPLTDRMAALAASRRRAAERMPAADRIPTAGRTSGSSVASVPPLPPASPATRVASSGGPLDFDDSDDPLAGLPAGASTMLESKLKEMVRKIVRKALAEQKNK